MNNEFINYYDKLGLPKDGKYEEGFYKGHYISIEAIQNAMERLKRQFGWDSFEVRSAQEAYNVLTDPIKRAEYNAKLEEYLNSSNLIGADSNEIIPEKSKVVPEEVKIPEIEIPEKPEVAPEEAEITPEEPEVTPEEPVMPLTRNNQINEETLMVDAEIKAANRKRIIKNSLIIGASTLYFGPIGTIAAIAILKKKGKLKLQKLSTKGQIKEIKTLETNIIESENKKLETDIDALLNSPLNDNQSRYKLELAKLRYQHHVDLLQKRIEFKKEQKNELGGKSYNRLYVLALEMKYAAAIKSLEVRKKIAEDKLNALNSYNPSKNKKDQLTQIQEQINKTKDELQKPKTSNLRQSHNFSKLVKLNSRKITTINKMSLKKNGISRNQVLLAVFNSAKNKVANLFSRKEEKLEETMDLNSFSGPVR